MIDAAEIQKRHERCGCVTVAVEESSSIPTVLVHQNCRLEIDGLRLAIDCDRCHAFAKDQKRPDLMVLQEVNSKSHWLVIEIKETIRLGARLQLEAGLEVLAAHRMFASPQPCGLGAILAYERPRMADWVRLREPLCVQDRSVPMRVVQCGDGRVL